MSTIDVVVPCYRYGRYLQECVHSVLSQGVSGVRILIIDDKSPDDTPEVAASLLREDHRVAYRRHASNCGHIPTYNEGIEWASADYMLLLSADDYLLPGALERAIAVLDAFPGMGLCFGNGVVRLVDGTQRSATVGIDVAKGATAVLSGAEFIDLCTRERASNIVLTPTAVVRTCFLKKLGGYRPDLPHSGDLELWLRLAAHGLVGIVGSEQAVYRRHETNMSLDYFRDGWLPDLQQRKAAFDAFHETCRAVLVQADRVHERFMRQLSYVALGYARSALNQRDLKLARRLNEFAFELRPRVWRSSAWIAYQIKRLLGFRVSSALLPVATRIRAVATRVRPRGVR